MEIPRWTVDLRAAEGYLELGMAAEADKQLESVPAEFRNLPDIVNMRILVSMALGKWDLAAGLSRHMLSVAPGVPGYWINCAYSVRRAESVTSAEEILLAALKLHPAEAMIHYNLACYAAVTGRRDEAEARLGKAFVLDGETRDLARHDQDLQLLWSVIDRIGCDE